MRRDSSQDITQSFNERNEQKMNVRDSTKSRSIIDRPIARSRSGGNRTLTIVSTAVSTEDREIIKKQILRNMPDDFSKQSDERTKSIGAGTISVSNINQLNTRSRNSGIIL